MDCGCVEHSTSSGKELVKQAKASCSAYFGGLTQFDLPDCHPIFLTGLETLTDSFDASVYLTFIDAFGTRYIQKGFMGTVYGEHSIILEQVKHYGSGQCLSFRDNSNFTKQHGTGAITALSKTGSTLKHLQSGIPFTIQWQTRNAGTTDLCKSCANLD
jgi:hypothetical protein